MATAAHADGAQSHTFLFQSIFVMLLAAVVAFCGLGTLPLKNHEVLVIQSAKEMDQRGSLVVPYFNDEPRLKKPPLSYWATELVVKLTGGHYGEAIGRTPSALAAVLMVALTLWMGTQLFGPNVGVYSGLILATTSGFVRFAHRGSPEMLYAALCTAMIPLFIQAWRTKRASIRIASAYGMWVCFGLATLAKGPHIPAALVLAFLLILARHPRSRKKALAILRPLAGILIALAVAAPWWMLLHSRVGDSLASSELMGSRYQLSLLAVLNPYYFYRSWSYLLPWAILVPMAIRLCIDRRPRYFQVRSLAIMLFMTAFILSFGAGRHPHYMLPALAPACVLLGRAAWEYFGRSRKAAQVNVVLLRLLAALHILILAVLIGRYFAHRDALALASRTILGMAVTALFVAPVLVYYLWPRARHRISPAPAHAVTHGRREFLTMALGFAVFFCAMEFTGVDAEPSRWSRKELGLATQGLVRDDDELLSYRVDARELVYYCDHAIRPAKTIQALEDYFEATAADTVFVITVESAVGSLMEWRDGEVVRVFEKCEDDTSWVLMRFQHDGTEPRRALDALHDEGGSDESEE